MAQSPKERKAAQRKVAKQVKRGESPLGGEFRRYYEEAVERQEAIYFGGGKDYLGGEPPIPEAPSFEEEFELGAGNVPEIVLDYDPTKTTWPGNGWHHRRTTRAGYDPESKTLAIEFFTNGAIYHYYGVEPDEARAFRRAVSPGKFINARLNSHPYRRVDNLDDQE